MVRDANQIILSLVLQALTRKKFRDMTGGTNNDYKAFKKLRKSILAKLQDKYAAWTVDSATVGSKLKKTKKKLSSASDLLLARLDIIENAYEKVNALGKKATKAQITKANKSALKDSASMYESFNSLLEQAQDVLG